MPGLALPRPSELKQTSHTEADLFRYGRQFVEEFPRQRVQVDGDRARYSPSWEKAGATFDDLAFAIYSFDLEDFDRAQIINVWWEEGGSDLTAWYGFANFERDRWDWTQASLDPTGHDKPGDGIRFNEELHIDPATSRMFFVPVFLDTGAREVSEIHIGGLRPISVHGIFPNAGVPDQVATFSAFVAGSEPISYHWDFGNGASPNTSTEKNPVVTLDTTGIYELTLSLTSPFDARIFKFSYEVLGIDSDWSHTWGGVKGDRTFSVCIDDEDSAYIVGFSESFDTGGRDALLLKYNEVGNLLWKRTWGGMYLDDAYGVCLDPDNDLVVVGRTSSFESELLDVFLLKLDGDGNLLWEKIWQGRFDDEAWSVTADQLGNIYLAGATTSFGAGAQDVLLLKFDGDGDLVWQRTWGRALSDVAYGICLSDDGHLYLAGRTQSSVTPTFDSFILKYDTDGNLLWQRTWGTEASDWTWGVATDGSNQPLVTGNTAGFNQLSEDAFLLKYDADGNLLWQRTWDGGTDDFGYGVDCDADGNAYIGGSTDNMGIQQVLLLKFSPAGALLGSDLWEHTIYSHTYLGKVLAVDGEGAVRLVGSTEYVTGGAWSETSGTPATSSGVTATPAGLSMVPMGIVLPGKGTLMEQVGILDTGSGFNDTLVLKHTML